jgi:hypothetical protein
VTLPPASKTSRIFPSAKGPAGGQPISMHGMQRCMEYPKGKDQSILSSSPAIHCDTDVACRCRFLHDPRSPRAWQCENHELYCRVSNIKVQRDYFKAMEVIMLRTAGNQDNPFLKSTGRTAWSCSAIYLGKLNPGSRADVVFPSPEVEPTGR